jgi:LAO/AO transport system kinase
VRNGQPQPLVSAARAGDRISLARLLSLIERGGAEAAEIGRLVYPEGGSAYTVGLTGAPGSGKSTLTSALVAELRRDQVLVAVLAVDPSSPFSGGAILGDRVRMDRHVLDDGVFIRSMATRGHLGGLALATPQAVRLLDAVGYPWVLVETVGVGQVEVEVAGAADTTVVVVNPGWGDAIQANKAGLMEIADVFVINKADRPGADDTRRDLEQMLDLGGHRSWRAPVVATVATEGDGAAQVWDAVRDHRAFLERDGALAERRSVRLRAEVDQIVVELLRARAGGIDGRGEVYQAVIERQLDPWTAATSLIDPPEAAEPVDHRG